MRRFVFLLVLLSAGARAVSADVLSEVSWLDDVQSQPKALPEDAPKLSELIGEGTSLDDWPKQRHIIREKWLAYLGPLATAERKTPMLKVLTEETVDGVVRRLVEYEAEPGETTQAYLLKPAKLEGKTAGVAVFHSTVDHSIHQPAGVKGVLEKAFGLKLAQRGYVAFCPRNFLWPTNDKIDAHAQTAAFQKKHPESKGMAKMLYDAMLAVDILAAQSNVDPERIGTVGHSLGAKEALYLAAFDERVKVTVSSEGGVGTRFSNWDAPWYLGPDSRTEKLPGEHHQILALVAPRPFLLIGGDSADGDRSWPFIERTLPIYRLYRRSPRLGLLNHGQGHAVPPEAEEKIYDWFTTYLPVN